MEARARCFWRCWESSCRSRAVFRPFGGGARRTGRGDRNLMRTHARSGHGDGHLDRVRARFGQWIQDTAAAEYDDAWLRWQLEIGRRHHRTGKNETDEAASSAIVPFRYLFPLAQPIVHTLRPFLEHTGEPRESVDAMQDAWRKSVLLQVTLWSLPYVTKGDF